MSSHVRTRWSLDPNSSVPLHVQLAEHIRWSVSAGELAPGSMLPPIRELARQLGVSLNTVKAAYQDLQRGGLLLSRRGHGTRVVSADQWKERPPRTLEETIESTVRSALSAGYTLEDLERMTGRIFSRFRTDHRQMSLLFVECDEEQLQVLGQDIRAYLGVRVEKILTTHMAQERSRLVRRSDRYLGIVTTYFHYREVRETLGDLGLPLLGVVLTTSPSTVTSLSHIPPASTVGAVCRDPESLRSFAAVVEPLVPPGTRIVASLIGDDQGVDRLVAEAHTLVATVPARRHLASRAKGKPVYAMYDRVDPASLHILAQHFALPVQAEVAATRQFAGE